MLSQRILSALVMAPPALLAVWFGSPFFEAMLALAALVMAWEWDRICGAGRFGATGAVAGLGAAVAALLAARAPLLALGIVLAAALGTLLAARVRRTEGPAWHVVGALYVGLPVVALAWLREVPAEGRELVVWLLVVVWATDIGGYLFGRTIGGPRLAPRISPKKTWAGLLGGMACAASLAAALSVLPGLPGAVSLALAGAALAVVAQAGDLGESWVKRHFGVKDSSAIIPGHGGLLDRVDGLLTAAVAVAAVKWVQGVGAW